MSVNGITNVLSDTYNTYEVSKKGNAKSKDSTNKTSEETSAIYAPSEDSDKVAPKKTYKSDPKLIAKLKADAEERTAQFKSLVEKIITKQATTSGNADDIWKFLASGKFTVDAATKEQAQKDIAEDGYWGVEQTSDRIIDFANALTGGDPEKTELMKDAFIKGFKEAEKIWGGELPEISQKTYDAVIKKFEKLSEQSEDKTTIEDPSINGND